MNSSIPSFIIDRPFPWIHFRLTVKDWHPLVAMSQPRFGTRWQELHNLGIHNVLRLSEESQDYNPSPLRMLGLIAMEDQYENEKPTNAAHEELRLIEAVRLLRDGLRHGGVAIHCVGGRGRTGTVVGAFLHTLGVPHATIIERLNLAYQTAGRPGWPESPWQAEVVGRIRL